MLKAMSWPGLWLLAALVVACSPSVRAADCPALEPAQRHLVQISKLARAFRDGIDKVYIAYTRADFKSKIDDLAADRVFEVQSFLTNHLAAVHLNAWQAFELLGSSRPLSNRQVAVEVSAYLTAKIASDLDRIESYEHHTGNLYDRVSNLARRERLVEPHADIGTAYGTHFEPLLQGLRHEFNRAIQAIQQLNDCVK